MLKPLDFDNVQANSNFTPLAPGGYVCRIMGVEEGVTRNGAPTFNVSLDIAEGPESNRFANEYRANTRPDKKWGCVYRQLITTKDGGTSPFFKGLITAIEESNGMAVQWTDNQDAFAAQFKGKLVGVIFGREEYAKQDGSKAWSTKAQICVPVAKIRSGDFEVPVDKPLAQLPGEYHTPGYTAPQFDQSAVNQYLGGSVTAQFAPPPMPSAEPADLPF